MDSSKPHPSHKLFLNGCLSRPTIADGEPCPICLQDYDLAPASTDAVDEADHILCETPSCGHKFGFPCLSVWAKQHNTCPMCREVTYQRDIEEQTSNRSMLHELMMGEEWDTDENDEYHAWSMEEHPATANDLDSFSNDVGSINSDNSALRLHSLEIASNSGDETDEGEIDWATEAVREYKELQHAYRERLE